MLNNLLTFSMLGAFLLLLILLTILNYKIHKQENGKLARIVNGLESITPMDLFKIRSEISDFTGIYIIYNASSERYYVGQSKRVVNRVNQHFTGHGNGDIYADFKYGDIFTLKMLSLNNSGYDSLDELEKDTIEYYGAFALGYNRTRGNGWNSSVLIFSKYFSYIITMYTITFHFPTISPV